MAAGIRRFWALATLCGVLAACGASPPAHFYTLDPVPSATATRSRISGPPVQVGDVTVPPSLDRRAMVFREGGNRLRISDQEEWAAPLDGMIRRVLAQDLAQRLPPGKVLAPGEPAPHGGARSLVVSVQQFISDGAGHVVLEADWSLVPPDGTQASRHGAERVTVPVGGSGGDAVAAAMSRALGLFADRVVSRL